MGGPEIQKPNETSFCTTEHGHFKDMNKEVAKASQEPRYEQRMKIIMSEKEKSIGDMLSNEVISILKNNVCTRQLFCYINQLDLLLFDRVKYVR